MSAQKAQLSLRILAQKRQKKNAKSRRSMCFMWKFVKRNNFVLNQTSYVKKTCSNINFLALGPGFRILYLSSRFQGGNFTYNPIFKSKISKSSIRGPKIHKNDLRPSICLFVFSLCLFFLIGSPGYYGFFGFCCARDPPTWCWDRCGM